MSVKIYKTKHKFVLKIKYMNECYAHKAMSQMREKKKLFFKHAEREKEEKECGIYDFGFLRRKFT
jgi:hypothetical protein